MNHHLTSSNSKTSFDLFPIKENHQIEVQENEPISLTSLSQSDQSLEFDSSMKRTRKAKKKVNICTDEDDDSVTVETAALRRHSETSDSVADHSAMSVSTGDGCLTVTGTIKRGKKAGQSVDVRLNMSREELEQLEAAITSSKRNSISAGRCPCSLRSGPHITLWTFICLPIAFLISSIYSFYMGTLTWYNIFTLYSEEKPIIYRILITPILILLYPFVIFLLTFGLGIYAALIQISWFWNRWLKEITDLEKGFYGWLCSALKHEDCSPYEVVILTDLQTSLDAARDAISASQESSTCLDH